MDSFLTACGVAGILTVEVEGPGHSTPEPRFLPQPFALIGRDDRADLVLDDEQVSRRHAFLQVIDGRAFFIDLESRVGTALDGSGAESGWIAPGQSLTIGPFRLKVTLTPSAEADVGSAGPRSPLLSRSSESSPGLPKISLEFQSRSAGHSVWRMSQLIALVGSSRRCKVRLFDSNVSKLHCALVRTRRGLWVVDLLSREGITINGAQARHARLRPSDVLGLGHVLVRPNFEDAPPPGPVGADSWGPPDGAGGGVGFNFGGVLSVPDRSAPSPWASGAGAPAFSAVPPDFLTPAVPTGAATTATPSQEPALAMLLGHFGQMQQQMLDQFQQSMFMMMQMFSGMHREQMGMMREELERLRELNQEIAAIKAELAARPGPGSGRPSVPTPPPQSPPVRPLNGIHSPEHVEPRRAPRPKPPTASAEMESPVNSAPPLEPSADVHDWLSDRLAAVTTEHQNRWQRIMSIVKGDK